MLTLTQNARHYFLRLVQDQDIAGLGIILKVQHGGTPQAECALEFCEAADLVGNEWSLPCEGFVFHVAAAATQWLVDAQIDYLMESTGGRLNVRAPHLKGHPPDADASLAERIRHVLDTEVNPQIAAHGGVARLVEVTADNAVVLQLGGGCHGCGMADVTLKQGIEKTLRAHFPQISAVRDATDHATGHSPYYRGKQQGGNSPLQG